jgi:hypothetical protein
MQHEQQPQDRVDARPAPGGCRAHAPITGGRRRPVNNGFALAVLLLAAALLAGCGGAKIVYQQLDVLLPWYFRDYVDLDTGQRQQLQRSVDTLLAWHRETEVMRYAAFFRELGQDARRPLGRDRLHAARMELEDFWDDIARRVTPDAAALLATLSDSQVEELFARIAEDDRKVERELRGRTEQERGQRREKALRVQLERWVGPLDPDQRAMVQACVRDMSANPAGWLESRRRWQGAFRDALALRNEPARFVPALERLLVDGEGVWPAEYRRQFDADRARVLQLIVDVDASLSSAQRDRLRRQLDRWALDFESIAGGA